MKPLNQWTFPEIVESVKRVDKKTWMTIGPAAVVSLLVLVFFVVPAWIERPLIRRDMENMEKQIFQVNGLSQKRRLWEENQRAFGDLIQETQTRLFTSEDLGVLLGQISKMGSESRVEVVASKPVVEKNLFAAPYHLRYQPSGYAFTLQGGYHDLASLVSKIESHEKLLRICGLQIIPSDNTTGRHISELKLWAILKASPQAAVPAAGAKNVKK
jgi:Tfp pilus assembly protein PilO